MLRLVATFLGGALILNSYIAAWLFPDNSVRSEISAMLGAIFLGAPLVISAVKDLLNGKLTMYEMAALAVVASFSLEYYAEAGLVAFFLYLGELIESRTALGAKAAIEDLVKLTPRNAHKLIDGKEVDTEVTLLKKGDKVRIRPGENVPADGNIIKGSSSLNEASVTGESLPADKEEGASVFAGTENYTGVIDIEVTSVGDDTTLGKVRHLILEAEATRLPLMNIIDQHVQWYTPMILMVAALIVFFTGNPRYAIAALVAACPCALVMATPTAMVAGLSCAARLGILIKNVTHLESAGTLTAVVCDKTGTLTTGELAVSRLSPADGIEAGHLLFTAASAEKSSNHPVARALEKVAKEADMELAEHHDMQETSGKGVSALVNGKKILVGRESWLNESKVDFSKLSDHSDSAAEGFSTMYVAEDGICIGWIGLEDHARPEARQAMEDLKSAGISTITMLTGDKWSVARKVSAELGCTEVVGECLPENKLQLVEEKKKQGYRVAVIGDGVNDAPALAAGDLGIAMGAAGNDIAVNSASVALLNNDLRRLPFMITLSRMVRKVVYQNLAFGVLFIIAGIFLSAFGKLTPIQAAIMHCLGSFPVIFNSARIVRQGESLSDYQTGSQHG
jgi:Cd2+/Zn2+-exporting ATPase